MAKAEIFFNNSVFFYLLVHNSERLRVFCSDNNAAGVSVNAVAKRGGKGIFALGIVLFFIIQIFY